MTANVLANKVKYWVESSFGYAKLIKDNNYIVELETTTTKTRASSIVTRIRLIVNELAGSLPFTVEKVLWSEPPVSRSSISLWKIVVTIPVKNFGRINNGRSDY